MQACLARSRLAVRQAGMHKSWYTLLALAFQGVDKIRVLVGAQHSPLHGEKALQDWQRAIQSPKLRGRVSANPAIMQARSLHPHHRYCSNVEQLLQQMLTRGVHCSSSWRRTQLHWLPVQSRPC